MNHILNMVATLGVFFLWMVLTFLMWDEIQAGYVVGGNVWPNWGFVAVITIIMVLTIWRVWM